jgi:hypothetical protein
MHICFNRTSGVGVTLHIDWSRHQSFDHNMLSIPVPADAQSVIVLVYLEHVWTCVIPWTGNLTEVLPCSDFSSMVICICTLCCEKLAAFYRGHHYIHFHVMIQPRRYFRNSVPVLQKTEHVGFLSLEQSQDVTSSLNFQGTNYCHESVNTKFILLYFFMVKISSHRTTELSQLLDVNLEITHFNWTVLD